MRWRRRLSQAVAGAAPGSPLRVLGPLRSRLVGEMTADDVLEVVHALDAAGVRHWLVGGWGVDALSGRQTRRHDDLDVILDRFDEEAGRARAALQPLGFELVRKEHSDVELPDRLLLGDGAGRSVDLVSMDLDQLRPLLESIGAAPDRDELFVTGTIGGRAVGCVSASVQRAIRAAFPPRPVDRFDLRVLTEEVDGAPERSRRPGDSPGLPPG